MLGGTHSGILKDLLVGVKDFNSCQEDSATFSILACKRLNHALGDSIIYFLVRDHNCCISCLRFRLGNLLEIIFNILSFHFQILEEEEIGFPYHQRELVIMLFHHLGLNILL